jgi:hypothetical protein
MSLIIIEIAIDPRFGDLKLEILQILRTPITLNVIVMQLNLYVEKILMHHVTFLMQMAKRVVGC